MVGDGGRWQGECRGEKGKREEGVGAKLEECRRRRHKVRKEPCWLSGLWGLEALTSST